MSEVKEMSLGINSSNRAEGTAIKLDSIVKCEFDDSYEPRPMYGYATSKVINGGFLPFKVNIRAWQSSKPDSKLLAITPVF